MHMFVVAKSCCLHKYYKLLYFFSRYLKEIKLTIQMKKYKIMYKLWIYLKFYKIIIVQICNMEGGKNGQKQIGL